jgi:ABC-type phosphate transport system ATPase subunit
MATDTLNAFQDWQQYLQQEDFEYLIQYIENIKNGIPNYKMIILIGPGRNGKTTLINEIETHLGDELFGVYDVDELIYEQNIKPLILLQDGILYRTNRTYKGIKNFPNALINFINYGVSFIVVAYNLHTVNERILEHSRIIEMMHIFAINT